MPRKATLALALSLLTCLLPAALLGRPLDPAAWNPGSTLFAADGNAKHHFGAALALQGNTALVGAPGWNNTGGDYTGAAYVFTNQLGAWSESARLLASDAYHHESFGAAVALGANTAIIGAPDARLREYGQPGFAPNAGAVYVFAGSGANWTEQAKLQPENLVDDTGFGQAVALDGDTLVVGAPVYFADVPEAVYFYARSGGSWGAPQKLVGADGDHNFGAAVAIAGDVALVGAPGINCCDEQSPFERGVVYVFTRAAGVWSAAGSFAPADGFPGDNFGCEIAFDGATAVVAACQAHGLAEYDGYAYVFTREGANWTQAARLEPEVVARFKINSVALDGDRLVLGSDSVPPAPSAGRLFPYRREGATWVAGTPLPQPDEAAETRFATALALDGPYLLAGAWQLPRLNVPEQGGVYAFDDGSNPPPFRAHAPLVVAPSPPFPDGRIAFTGRGRDNNFDIFVIRPDGSGKTNLTDTPGNESDAAWSPDGERLAFGYTGPDYRSMLVTINASGGDRRTVLESDELESYGYLAWSPDGTRLAFSAYANDSGWDVYVVDRAGTGLANLTPDLPGENSTPAWSPDGSAILFSNYGSGGGARRRLVTVSPDGGAPVYLTGNDRHYNDPAYSPDGARILFTSDYNGQSALYTMPAAGGAAQLLLPSAAMGGWSPDGQFIVFVGDAGGLFWTTGGGQGVAPVTTSSDVFFPDWQP